MSKDSIPSELQRSAAQNTLSKISQNIDEKINKLNLPSFFKNKFLLGGLMITALIAITLVSLGSFSSSETDIPTYKVTRGNFLVSITESGEIRAKRSLNAAAPRIRGNLKIVFLIPEGTYVQPGEVVAKFDPTEALSKLKDAEAQLEIARSDMEKLAANHKAALAQAESQLKSAELSFELSKLKMEQIKFEAEVKQQEAKLEHQKNELSFMQTKQEYESKQIIQNSELDKMKVEIRQKETELERAQRDLEALTLTAPGEGLVVYADNWSNQGRKYSVGDTPWGGAVVIQLPDLSEMESVTNVNEVDVSKIKEGQKV
ncbi:MAG: HlyD family secretion protein, partial [Melioribacteraceae bacterium]|nr:HlyD family secretion protein [Melioribacteraceae bacterium]